MTLFEYVCENQRILTTLVQLGVVPCDINHNVTVYRKYLEYRQTCRRMQAVENVAQDVRQSSRNVFTIIQKMEQKV